MNNPRVVAIGGGTGLPVLLRGLKEHTSEIAAIVTVTDDGGSSGRLRGELGILPPGDIRNCLVALAGAEPLMERLFQHRFSRGSMAGHPFGNLFIGALTELLGDFEAAVRAASLILRVHGRVLPSTLENVQLSAELADGSCVDGETAISLSPQPVRRVRLSRDPCPPVPAALQAIADADLIVIGPGSLYTSIMPNLLVDGVAAAIRRSPAPAIYVVNIMTQPGETDGYSAADHLQAIIDHVGPDVVQAVLVNAGPVGEDRVSRYLAQGAFPVVPDAERLEALGVEVYGADLVNREDLIRHDAAQLAAAVLTLARRVRRRLSASGGRV